MSIPAPLSPPPRTSTPLRTCHRRRRRQCRLRGRRRRRAVPPCRAHHRMTHPRQRSRRRPRPPPTTTSPASSIREAFARVSFIYFYLIYIYLPKTNKYLSHGEKLFGDEESERKLDKRLNSTRRFSIPSTRNSHRRLRRLRRRRRTEQHGVTPGHVPPPPSPMEKGSLNS